jgi:two-component system nitrate/nitrite response regulator NarL
MIPDRNHAAIRVKSDDAASLRVILADDHLMVLEILSDALTTHAAMDVAKAGTLDDALLLAETTPDLDLIVLDFDMPGMNGYAGLARMVALNKAPVAILTSAVHLGMAEAVQVAGGVGVMSKTQGIADIIKKMFDLGYGSTFFFPPQDVSAGPSPISLTEKQACVMRMIESGLSNSDIGKTLGMPLSTVKMHVRSIFKRLGARNRTDAVRIWHSQSEYTAPTDPEAQ